MNDNFSMYKKCSLCPRNCQIDRNIKKGYCGQTSELGIESALLHFGEEPPISFENGSGAIFFNGCSLRCVFCQNMQISQNNTDKKKYSLAEFTGLIETLINKGAENINFVTPDHFLPHIIEGIKIIKQKNINIPIIYNCSGYETISHLKKTLPFVDIYLFDYKYAKRDIAEKYSNAPDYPKKALEGLKFIYEHKGNLLLSASGKAKQGVLARHLVLPGHTGNSVNVLDNIFFETGNALFLSLMSQYSPQYLRSGFSEINRRINHEEYNIVTEHVKNLGFKNCYIQELPGEKDDYTPDFKEKKMFDKW